MFVEFRVRNYRSIGAEQVISLVPANNLNDVPENILEQGKHRALNALAFYGANSSGKSNLLKAMELLDRLLFLSAKSSSTDKLPYDPNLLIAGFQKTPTKLEITIVIDKTRYRYGVEFDSQEILGEWLFRKNKGREVELFVREGEVIDVSSGFKASQRLLDTAIEATRSNGLFLSVCDMFNVQEAKTLFEWFNQFIFVDGLDTSREEVNTISLFENEAFAEQIRNYLISLNLGFEDLVVRKKPFSFEDFPDELDDGAKNMLLEQLGGKLGVKVHTVHATYNEKGNKTGDTIQWPMDLRESAGTRKAFQFSGPVLYTLMNGGVLVVDEIEAKIHPILTLNTIELFLSKTTNQFGAQIIFATHDTNLLTYLQLRRDQICFVEKSQSEATETYSLAEVIHPDGSKDRQDAKKEKRYLEGRYGGIPCLGTLEEQIFSGNG